MLEAEDVADLREKAGAVDPCLVEMVERDAPWNALSKATLIETGPNVSADLLNACGIGADKADLVAFGFAALAIYRGHAKIAGKLDRMLKEKLEREEKSRREREQGSRGEREAA